MSNSATASATAPTRPKHHGWWWKLLLAGVAVWVITVIVTVVTQNSNLVPTIILVGSFLVPLVVVMFAADRVRGNLTTTSLLLAFVVGGIFGVLGASLLEVDLPQSFVAFLGAALAEETVKGILLVIIGWRIVPKDGYQGGLLGATVGAGFAAFESAGYAFNATMSQAGSINLGSLVQTEAIRGVLTPVGHVLWTAILGAAIFAAARGAHHYRWRWSILLAFAAAVVLHALWDLMGAISAFLAIVLSGATAAEIESGSFSSATANLATVLYVIGLAVISAVGILILRAFVKTPRSDALPASAGSETPAGVR